MPRSLYARLHRRFGPRPDDLTRREFLERLAVLAAAVPLASCASTGSPKRRSDRRVVVVGAGLAGLACARELRAAGVDVVVLEARSRIGGRVLSFGDLVAGKTVEGGGEFVGENHPTWLAYANAYGLELARASDDESLESPVVLGGTRLEKDDAEALYREMSEAYARLTADAAAVDANEPWTSPGAAALDARDTAAWLAKVDVPARARLAVAIELVANNGAALERQSYLGNLAQVKGGGLDDYWTKTETFRCRGGNATLAARLASDVGADRIRLGSPATRIAVDRARAAVIARGETIEADDVVLAVPPSTWPRIEFAPPLPIALRPQMGIDVKWLSVLSGRFWTSRGLAPVGLTDGDVSETWEATDGQPGDDGAVLTAFSGGPAAAACRSREPQAREAAYRAALEQLFPGFGASLVGSRFMDWPGDEWTRGAYSFPAPGEVVTMGPILREGLGRLHFAGEHTCPAFVGYMEGALSSGTRIARRLI
jgi:monoamine oxidase